MICLVHTALSVPQFLIAKNMTVLSYPPYSPKLAPCSIFLFPRELFPECTLFRNYINLFLKLYPDHLIMLFDNILFKAFTLKFSLFLILNLLASSS